MKITHDKTQSKFSVEINGAEAYLKYSRGPRNSFNITHTAVPVEARGQGVAEELVRAAVQEAKNEKVQIIATCSYARKWFEKHPEEKSILLTV